jgi:hypothetical protein
MVNIAHNARNIVRAGGAAVAVTTMVGAEVAIAVGGNQ